MTTPTFTRVERARIQTLQRLAAFLEEKAKERAARGVRADYTISEAVAIRWALRVIGASDVSERAAIPAMTPGKAGQEATDGERREQAL